MKRTIYRQKRLEHNIQGNARETKGTWQERRHVAFIPSHCLQRYDVVGTISSDQLEGTRMRNFSNIEDNPKSPTFMWTVLWRWDNVLLTCSLTVSRFRTQSGLHNQNAGFISFLLPFLLWSLLSRDDVLLTCSLTVSRFRTQSGLHNQNAGFISFSLPFLLWSLLSRDNVLLTCSLTVSRFRTQSGLHNQNAGFISFVLPFLLWSLLSRDNVLLTCSLTVSRFRTQSGLHNQNAGFISFRYHSSSDLSCPEMMFFWHVLWLSHVSGLNPDSTTRMQDSSPFCYHSSSDLSCPEIMFFWHVLWLSHVSGLNPDSTTRMQDSSPFRYHSSSDLSCPEIMFFWHVLWLSHVSGLNPDSTTRMQDSSPFVTSPPRWDDGSFDMFFDCLTFPDSIRTPQPECRIHLLFVTIPPLNSLVQR